MSESAEQISKWVIGHLRDELNVAEKVALDAWINASPDNLALFQRLTHEERIRKGLEQFDSLSVPDIRNNDKIWEAITQHEPRLTPETAPLLRLKRLQKYAAAAAVLLLVGFSVWLLLGRRPEAKQDRTLSFAQRIHPGGSKATLRLGNGMVIQLDSTGSGQLAKQGNIQIVKLKAGQLVYKPGASLPDQSMHNTIMTPRGGQYEIVLSDGTKVWLNAASSLQYPVSFSSAKREVELTGEAYFEVAPDQGKAFIVHISSGHPAEKPTSIEVLGTSFDVMEYPDEPAMTTSLVNGSVKVIRGTSSVLLKPGEQASIKTGDPEGIHVVTDADMTGALAWKNGLFRFNGNDIQSVMRQISRWYDVDVRYEGDVSAHFLGTISRKADVTEVFRILKLTEAVDFKIEGKTIIVIPKNQ